MHPSKQSFGALIRLALLSLSVDYRLRQNSAYWGALKDKLKFLSEDDSIDIKKISLQGKNDGGFLISLFVNGVISISESAYSSLSEKLSEFLKGCLR